MITSTPTSGTLNQFRPVNDRFSKDRTIPKIKGPGNRSLLSERNPETNVGKHKRPKVYDVVYQTLYKLVFFLSLLLDVRKKVESLTGIQTKCIVQGSKINLNHLSYFFSSRWDKKRPWLSGVCKQIFYIKNTIGPFIRVFFIYLFFVRTILFFSLFLSFDG